jgi:Mn2+/Fe2+ NRAMP family transporter
MVAALASSREWNMAFLMFFFCSLFSAQGACFLGLGLVPVSLRRRIIENHALFIPGRKERHFIITGFFSFFNLIAVVVISPEFSLVPSASGVLGGLSLAILVMMLTLRSMRRSNNERTPDLGNPLAGQMA